MKIKPNQSGLANIKEQKEFLGILMLDTSFPRIIGDAGNIKSYPFLAKTSVVVGAGSLDIVQNGKPREELVVSFCNAAKKLESEGAKAIVSTCGFLISIQGIIQASVGIPVMVSALSLYHHIHQNLGIKDIGILTASSNALGSAALDAAGIRRNDVEIVGLEDCEAFTSAILQSKDMQSDYLDAAAIEQAAIEKALMMVKRKPNLGAILLECGNLPPYAAAINKATQLPVFSILDAAEMLMKSKLV